MAGTQYNDEGFEALFSAGPQTVSGYLSHPAIEPGSTSWDYQLATEASVVDEVIETGDGVETDFSGTLVQTPILSDGSVSYRVVVTTLVGGNPVQVVDDGAGAFSGDGTGTLNEATGEWTISWNDPPDNLADQLASYAYRTGSTTPVAIDDGSGGIVGDGLSASSNINYETSYTELIFTGWVECAGGYPCAAAIVDYFGDYVAAITRDLILLNSIVASRDVTLVNSMSCSRDVVLSGRLFGSIGRDLVILNRLVQSYARDLVILTSLRSSLDVARDVVLTNALAPANVPVVNSWDVILDGESVKEHVLFPVGISLSDANFVAECSLIVAKLDLLARFQTLQLSGVDSLVVTINGVDYRFLVNEITLGQTNPVTEFSVRGVSVASRLGNRAFTDPVTSVWESPVLASSIVDGLTVGYEVSFDLDDWLIPADVLSAENEMPIDVLAKLAKAQGGAMWSDPDGTLHLGHVYAIDPIELDGVSEGSLVATLYELTDVFSVDSEVHRSEGFNSVLVEGLNSPTNKTDAVVELDDERNGNRSSFLPGEWAFVRVYAMPFGLEYDHQVTKGSAVFLGSYEQTVTEEEINVRDGRASVRYPLKSVVLQDWDGRSFTGLVWREGQRDLSWTVESGCSGSARLLLTYTTQYDLWQVRALDEGEVILCLEDEQG